MKVKKITGVVAALVIVALLIVVSGSVVITQQNEFTVVRQFGEVVDIRSTPGVSLKMPFVQTASTLPNTVLLYDLPLSDV